MHALCRGGWVVYRLGQGVWTISFICFASALCCAPLADVSGEALALWSASALALLSVQLWTVSR